MDQDCLLTMLPREIRNQIYTELMVDEISVTLPWKHTHDVVPKPKAYWRRRYNFNDPDLNFDSYLAVTACPNPSLLRVNRQLKDEYEEETYRMAVLHLRIDTRLEMLSPAFMHDVIAAVPPAILRRVQHLNVSMDWDCGTSGWIEYCGFDCTSEAMKTLLDPLQNLKSLNTEFRGILDCDTFMSNYHVVNESFAERFHRDLDEFELFAQICRDVKNGFRVNISVVCEEKLYETTIWSSSPPELQALRAMNQDPNNYIRYEVKKAKHDAPHTWYGMDLDVVSVGYWDERAFKAHQADHWKEYRWRQAIRE